MISRIAKRVYQQWTSCWSTLEDFWTERIFLCFPPKLSRGSTVGWEEAENCLFECWRILGLEMLHSTCKISQWKDIILLNSFVTELLDQRYQNELSRHRHEKKRFLSVISYLVLLQSNYHWENHFRLYEKICITNSSAFLGRMDIQETSCALVENCGLTSFWKCTALQCSSCHTYGSSLMAGTSGPQSSNLLHKGVFNLCYYVFLPLQSSELPCPRREDRALAPDGCLRVWCQPWAGL